MWLEQKREGPVLTRYTFLILKLVLKTCLQLYLHIRLITCKNAAQKRSAKTQCKNIVRKSRTKVHGKTQYFYLFWLSINTLSQQEEALRL
jgi:hypothetical protein